LLPELPEFFAHNRPPCPRTDTGKGRASPMQSNITMTENQWRVVEYDDHALAAPFLIFTLAGQNVLTVAIRHLVCIEPA